MRATSSIALRALRAPASRILFAVFLGCAITSARADDVEDALERARTLAADEPDTAVEILTGVASDPEASDEQRVRGTRIAITHLPFRAGNRVASALLLATLRENRSQPDAWQLSFRIRDRVMDGLDLECGEAFLQSMIALYPDQMRFRYYLTDLYMKGGRPGDADRQCMEILRQAPNDTWARQIQGLLRELDGRTDEALELYQQIHDINGDLDPLLYRVRILIDPVRDYAAAELALREAFAAVETAPVGRTRNKVRADLEYEQSRLEDERERRSKLLETAARIDELVLKIGAGWALLLGGGLMFLRRRRLV